MSNSYEDLYSNGGCVAIDKKGFVKINQKEKKGRKNKMGYSITKADCEMMTLEELNEQYNIINSVLEEKRADAQMKAIKEFRTALYHVIDSGIDIRWTNGEYSDEWISCYEGFRFLNEKNGKEIKI